jgi:hypothetical protein
MCASFLSQDAHRPCNPGDNCRAHLRQHCEPAVPRASSCLAFGSSQCPLLWARPRPRTRLIRRPQNACVADLSLDMARRYTRTVPMISRGSRIACCCSGHQRVRHLGQDLFSVCYVLSNQERPVGVTKALQGVNQLIVAPRERGSFPLMLLITATVPATREWQYRSKRLIRCNHV